MSMKLVKQRWFSETTDETGEDMDSNEIVNYFSLLFFFFIEMMAVGPQGYVRWRHQKDQVHLRHQKKSLKIKTLHSFRVCSEHSVIISISFKNRYSLTE